MEVVHSHCAGLDIHKKSIAACIIVPGAKGQSRKEIRTFGTMTEDIVSLAEWLSANGVTHVAMESTGEYWKPIVRHEALYIREGMKEPLRETVAAVC